MMRIPQYTASDLPTLDALIFDADASSVIQQILTRTLGLRSFLYMGSRED